jgi:hypothetical protein
MRFLPLRSFWLLAFFTHVTLPAANPVLLTAPHLWQRAEWRIDDAPSAENNFDPEQIQIDAIFTAPSGRTIAVPAFWYQGFTRTLVGGEQVLTAVGAPEWRLRFTPDEAGAYTLSLKIAAHGKPAETSNKTRFSVENTPQIAQHGWVRTAADHRFFETSDGRSLRLIGANVCWGGARATYNYDLWFSTMRDAGENYARIWFAPWSMGLEHKPGTLNRYDLSNAWEFDHVLELADRYGIYLLLAMDHHGMFMSNDPAWGGANNYWTRSSPYAVENGGPCATANEFFTKPEALKIYQKRLRYLIGRYGYSPRLLSWQFFNEIDNAYLPRSTLVGDDVVTWHREMGQWLRANDPYRHLISTSLTGASIRPEYWAMPEMDFSVYHAYGEADPAGRIAKIANDLQQRYQKPVMIGEFGVSAAGWNIAMDPYLRGLRQGLWGGVLGGSVGTSMSWWWENLHAEGAYPLYTALRDIMARAGWNEGTWAPLSFIENGPVPTDLGEPLADGEPFTAQIALNELRLNSVSGEAAITSPLAAARAAERIAAYLHGTRNPKLQQHAQLTAWFADRARLVFRVNAFAADAELLVRIDDTEKLRVPLSKNDSPAVQNEKLNKEYLVDIPAGKHRVEIAHTGADWVNLKSVRLERVRPAAFADGWSFQAEAIGLQRGDTAVVYVHSPHVAWPAGALVYNPPIVTGATITLANWPGENSSAVWFDPKSGRIIATAPAVGHEGKLQLPLPDFDEDVVGIVTRTPAR